MPDYYYFLHLCSQKNLGRISTNNDGNKAVHNSSYECVM